MILDRQTITAVCDVCGKSEQIHSGNVPVTPFGGNHTKCDGEPPEGWRRIDNRHICPDHQVMVLVDGSDLESWEKMLQLHMAQEQKEDEDGTGKG